MVHNDSTDLDLNLDPVEDSTLNLISIIICGKRIL